MSMYETILYDDQDGIATLKLNRPARLNALNFELIRELAAGLRQAGEDANVRAILLTGAGKGFCSGADLTIFQTGPSPEEIYDYLVNGLGALTIALSEIPKPVIAAVPGSAAGIGMSMALQCDLLIMADNAFLLSPFTTISLVPDGGLNWMLVRQLGYRRAFQLSVESERISAERCVELGLANKAVPAEMLMDAALEWADALSKRAPLSLAATKQAMRFAMDHDWARSYDVEAQLQGELLGTEDNEEGINAFFEKRPPEFKGK